MRYTRFTTTDFSVDLPGTLQAPGRAEALAAICERYGVKRLDVFGSAAIGRFDPARSDVDLMVEFFPESPPGAFAGFLAMEAELTSLFGRRADVTSPPALENSFFRRSVQPSLRQLYGRVGPWSDGRPLPA